MTAVTIRSAKTSALASPQGQGDEARGQASSSSTVVSSDKTLKLYTGYVHDLLNDIGKEAVMADITGWITKRLPVA